MKERCVKFLNLKKSKQKPSGVLPVLGETFLGLTSEEYSATIQVITSKLEVHPKHI